MWTEVQDALRESMSRTMTGLASLLPGVVAMLLALVVASLVGWAIARLVMGILGRAGFDARLERLGIDALAEWSPGRSPTRLVGRLIFWVMVLAGFAVGLTALDATTVSVFASRLVELVPNLFVAAVLLAAGTILARFLSRSVLISAVNMQVESARLISLGVKWMVLLMAAAMALNQVHIGGQIVTLAFGILFGGIVLALALAVGLGSKDVVSRTWEQQSGRAPDRPAPSADSRSHL